jgi:hypothetical protein
LDLTKLLNDEKFLTKAKDLAQGQKFEPVPPKLSEHWVTRMWVAGVIGAIYWSGYEIVPKKETK